MVLNIILCIMVPAILISCYIYQEVWKETSNKNEQNSNVDEDDLFLEFLNQQDKT